MFDTEERVRKSCPASVRDNLSGWHTCAGEWAQQMLLGPGTAVSPGCRGTEKPIPSHSKSPGSQANTEWHGHESEQLLHSLTKELLLPISRMKEKQKTFFSSLAVITGNFQTPDKLFLSSHTILGKSRVCPPCVRDDEKWITCYNCSYGSGKIQYCCMVCTPTVHGTSQC